MNSLLTFCVVWFLIFQLVAQTGEKRIAWLNLKYIMLNKHYFGNLEDFEKKLQELIS